jgi:6-pyruvoyltetrahydropterin/6-carboxytetrahydropterin synthase
VTADQPVTATVARHAATITKTFRFAASHRLTGLPDGHKCARLHGHNYQVTVLLSGDLDDAGMVLDYGELSPLRAYLDRRLDHRHLGAGDVCDGDGKVTDPAAVDFNPTAENLAAHLLKVAVGLFGDPVIGVEVCENDTTSASAVRG